MPDKLYKQFVIALKKALGEQDVAKIAELAAKRKTLFQQGDAVEKEALLHFSYEEFQRFFPEILKCLDARLLFSLLLVENTNQYESSNLSYESLVARLALFIASSNGGSTLLEVLCATCKDMNLTLQNKLITIALNAHPDSLLIAKRPNLNCLNQYLSLFLSVQPALGPQLLLSMALKAQHSNTLEGELQSHLVEEAILHGAVVDWDMLYEHLPITSLHNTAATFLKSQMTPKIWLLGLTLMADVTKDKHLSFRKKLAMQTKLIKSTLEHHININHLVSRDLRIDIDPIYRSKHLFLEKDLDAFLRLVLLANLGDSSRSLGRRYYYSKLEVQAALVIEITNKGGDINAIAHKAYMSTEALEFHAQMFLYKLKKPLTADNFLKIAILSRGADRAIALLVERALGLGANPNLAFNNIDHYPELTALGFASSQPITFNVLKRARAVCGHLSEKTEVLVRENNLNKIEAMNFQKHNKETFLTSTRSLKPLIPTQLHFVWLTRPDNAKHIAQLSAITMLSTVLAFKNSVDKWDYTLWTNVQTLDSLDKLKDHGLKIKLIDDFKENMGSFHSTVISCVNHGNLGVAVDLLRLWLIMVHGGIVIDLMTVVPDIRAVDDATHSFTFFILDAVENGFYGATPNHPIIIEAANTVLANAQIEKRYSSSREQLVDTFNISVLPLALSIIKNSNTNNNLDIVYPIYARPVLGAEEVFKERNSSCVLMRDLFDFTNIDVCPAYLLPTAKIFPGGVSGTWLETYPH